MVWIERATLSLIASALIGLAVAFGLWAAIYVSVGLMIAVGIIIVVRAGDEPARDHDGLG